MKEVFHDSDVELLRDLVARYCDGEGPALDGDEREQIEEIAKKVEHLVTGARELGMELDEIAERGFVYERPNDLNPLLRPKASKVVIHGYGPGGKFVDSAFEDPEFEVWGINLMTPERLAMGYDRWFELHPLETQEERHPFSMGTMRTLDPNDERSPLLYLQRYSERYATSVTYPIGEICERYERGHYHCGTFDYMVALACLLGFDEIHLRGITLAWGEPMAARACLEYWCGVAEGQGIRVVGEPWSDLFHMVLLVARDTPYGYRYLQHANQFQSTNEGTAKLHMRYAFARGDEPDEWVREWFERYVENADPLMARFEPLAPELASEKAEGEKKEASST
jgi:hypothetical protein